MGALYFGRWSAATPGHHAYRPDGSLASLPACLAGTRIDGGFCPPHSGQPEGVAALHHVDGATVIAFWDRSADHRFNSNSAFVVPGCLDFDAAVRLARDAFPTVWARFKFEVRR